MADLTAKQQQALEAYRDGGDVKDVAQSMGITQGAAYSHITALRKKGYIDAEGRLTTKAVIGNMTKPAETEGNAEAPDAADEPKAEAPSMNGRHESFAFDQEIAEQFRLRREELSTTIGQIETAVTLHRDRLAALAEESGEHEAAVKALESSLEQTQKALDAMPVVLEASAL